MTHPAAAADRPRWVALGVLCLVALMIVIDVTIVNVALPSIGADLGFTETGLTWVVNAYLLVFGGFLLLGGRLGDLYGARRVLVAGLVAFALASLGCGLAASQTVLVAARALQGLGGAVVDSVSLALIVRLFVEPDKRARAMGVYGFVCAAGGSIGVLLGGVLTSAVGWHWIFLVNVPVAAVVIVLLLRLLPPDAAARGRQTLDLGGAVAITAALLCLVYAVIDGRSAGWLSVQTLGLFGTAVLLFAAFVAVERRVAAPLMPLAMFGRRNLAVANVVAALWSAGMFAWFFIAALYLQLVLGYSAVQVGLAFLPANLLMAACSLGVSAWLVNRHGLRAPLAAGLGLGAIGLALFARAPADAAFAIDVLPGMLLLGLAGGIAFNPLLLAATGDVDAADAGLASGLVNTAFMMGGALGLAVLASIAAAGTEAAGAQAGDRHALLAGYRLAFGTGAALTALGAAAAWLLRPQAAAAARPDADARGAA